MYLDPVGLFAAIAWAQDFSRREIFDPSEAISVDGLNNLVFDIDHMDPSSLELENQSWQPTVPANTFSYVP